jgi:hypothetical protein
MGLSSIIDRVLPWCPGWEKQSGRKSLLALAQQALDELFDFDDHCMIYRPGNSGGNDGFPPYLPTTAGTFKYSVDSSVVGSIVHTSLSTTISLIPRKIKQVYIDITNMGYVDDQFYGETINPPYFDSILGYGLPTNRRQFVKVLGDASPAMTSANGDYIRPTFSFLKDPGTTTEKYFIEFYIGAPRLTNVTSEIPLSLRFEMALEDFIRGRVQELESGQPSPMLKKFYDFWITEFHTFMSTQARARRTSTPPNYV